MKEKYIEYLSHITRVVAGRVPHIRTYSQINRRHRTSPKTFSKVNAIRTKSVCLTCEREISSSFIKLPGRSLNFESRCLANITP